MGQGCVDGRSGPPDGSASGLALEYRAYEQIEAIITLEFPPQSPIVEVQLAERLGISKTPLRAALMQLEREDFVASVPYKGSRVAPISFTQISQLYQLREAIEVYAAVCSFAEADLDALEAILERQEQAVSARDYEAANVLDRQFHRYPVERIENPYMIEIFGNVLDHRRRLRHVLAGSSLDRRSSSSRRSTGYGWPPSAPATSRRPSGTCSRRSRPARTAAAAEQAGLFDFEKSQLAGSR